MISLLYVDDEPDLLDLCKLFLEREGDFSVVTVTSAKEGLRVLTEGMIDAIVSDYQMPGMEGIDFLKQVRADFKDIPFILFTGKGREEVVIEAIENGADFYLQKGGDPRAQFSELMTRRSVAALAIADSSYATPESERTCDSTGMGADAGISMDGPA